VSTTSADQKAVLKLLGLSAVTLQIASWAFGVGLFQMLFRTMSLHSTFFRRANDTNDEIEIF
jgi:hypothetical protein